MNLSSICIHCFLFWTLQTIIVYTSCKEHSTLDLDTYRDVIWDKDKTCKVEAFKSLQFLPLEMKLSREETSKKVDEHDICEGKIWSDIPGDVDAHVADNIERNLPQTGRVSSTFEKPFQISFSNEKSF